MNASVHLSVVIPTRDRPELLRDCLESLTNQDIEGDHMEVIVVDDGETNATRAVVQDLQGGNGQPRISYERGGGGPNYARNVGVARAQARLIAFLDDDVILPPGWATAVIDVAARHPEVGCIAGRIRLRLEGSPPRMCGREPLGETELELGQYEHLTERAWAANMVITRDALELAGPLDDSLPQYGEETEWTHRLTKTGGQILYAPSAWLWHRRPPETLALRRMLRARYHRGLSWPVIAPRLDRRVSVVGALGRALLGLGHALRRRCSVGLLDAAYSMGHARSAISLLMGRQHDDVSWWPNALPSRLWRGTHEFVSRARGRARK